MIRITGEISDNTALDVEKQLAAINGPVSVYIDSPGGDLFAGLKIYDMFSERDVNIEVRRAGSIASVISLAGKSRPTVQKGGGFAIHNAHTENIQGNHNDLRKVADSLEKYSNIVAQIYSIKTDLSTAHALSLMNDSITIDAHSALDLGFASKIVNSEVIENHIKSISNLSIIDMNLLQRIKNNMEAAPAEPMTADPEIMNEGFSPEQLEEINVLIKEAVAAALAGSTEEITEEIGNTIAVILNDIRSEGTPPQDAQVSNNVGASPLTGYEAFNKKMAQIKSNNQ